jgi:TP901 family phage tail tape measure protein
MASESVGFGEAQIDIRATLDKLDQDLSKARKRVSGALDKVGGDFLDLGGKVNSALLGAAKVAAGALAIGAGALGAVMVDSTKLAADFEDQVTLLGIAAKDSGPGFDTLHEAALQVGGDATLVGVNATGAADSLTGLYKAGLTTGEIFGDLQGYLAGTAELSGALRAAIDTAAATELDMVAASDLAAITLATFGAEMETEEERAQFINDAMNNFVQAADASVAEVGDLAEALRNVGPTAASFGFSLEETNNALAILSTRGITGAEAGTALKSMLVNIMRPTNQVTGALAELGVELYDEEGQMKDLREIVGQLQGSLYGASEVTTIVGGRTAEQNALLKEAQERYDTLTKRIRNHNAGLTTMSDKSLARANQELASASAIIEELSGIQGTAVTSTRELTEEQRNQYIQTLAGTYGMNAMNTLLAEGVEGWDAMAIATWEASTIQEVAAARAATFSGRMEALQGVIETIRIKIGEKLLPVATRLANWASDMADMYGPAVEEVFTKIGTAVGTLVDSLINGEGPLESIRDALASVAPPEVVEQFDLIVEKAQEIAAYIQEHSDAIIGFVEGIGVALAAAGIAAMLAAIANPITLIILAVGALGAAWESDFGGIRTWIETNWPTIQGTVLTTVENIKTWIDTNWPKIKETVTTTVDGIRTWLETNWPTIKETITTTVDGIRTWLETNWPTIQETVLTPIENIKTWIDTNWPTIQETVLTTVENIKTWIDTNWPMIQETVLSIVENIKTWFETNWPIIQAVFVTAWTVIKDVVLAVVDVFVNEVWPSPQAAFLNVEDAMATLGITWADVWDAIKLAVGIVAAAIGGIILLLIGIIAGFATAFSSVAEHITGVWADIASTFKKAMEGIAKLVGGIMAIVKGIFSGDLELIKAGIDAWGSGLSDLIGSIGEGIVNAFNMTFGTVIEAIGSFISGVIEFFTNLYERLVGHSIIPDMLNEILKVVTEGLATLLDKFGEIIQSIISKFTDTDWGEVGRNILEGVAEGISSGLEIIKEAARRAAQAALDAAKNFLGIESPSKVAADLIGEPFTEGIGTGILNALPDLLRASKVIGMELEHMVVRPRVDLGGVYGEMLPSMGSGSGTRQVVIYGLTLEGVQNADGLLAELQALA